MRQTMLVAVTIIFLVVPPVCMAVPQASVAEKKEAINSSEPENEMVERNYLRTETSGAHCGVYCVAAAIKVIGGEIDVKRLMQSKYISQAQGSTAADIVQMIEDSGYQATIINRLNGSTLAYSNSPVIIHLDGLRRVEKSHHWVCFLGIKGAKPLLFDPPNPVASVEYGDILAYTSGIGVIVSRKDASSEVVWFGKMEMLLWVGLCVSVVGGTSLFLRRVRLSSKWPRLPAESGALLFATLAVIAVQQLLPWASLLHDPVSIAHFQEIYSPPVLAAETDYQYVAKGVREKGISLIDARLPTAFGFGHIPGATNWPVDASTIESRLAFETIDASRPVVVYCQSDRCVWSDVIAARLLTRGVREVYVYRGGYREWQSKSN